MILHCGIRINEWDLDAFDGCARIKVPNCGGSDNADCGMTPVLGVAVREFSSLRRN
jgi:hypothetical protein